MNAICFSLYRMSGPGNGIEHMDTKEEAGIKKDGVCRAGVRVVEIIDYQGSLITIDYQRYKPKPKSLVVDLPKLKGPVDFGKNDSDLVSKNVVCVRLLNDVVTEQ